jgi:prevent-host-death family protein
LRGEEVSIDEVLAELDLKEARVSLEEASEHFADLYERAAAGHHVVIAVRGKPSVALVAAAELERLLEIAKRVTAET